MRGFGSIILAAGIFLSGGTVMLLADWPGYRGGGAATGLCTDFFSRTIHSAMAIPAKPTPGARMARARPEELLATVDDHCPSGGG